MSRTSLPLALAMLALALSAGGASAKAPEGTDRVEEDWVLVIEPALPENGPQLSTVMGPSSDLSEPVAVLDVNYRHDPTFTAGGLQVLVLDDSGPQSSKSLATTALQTPGEMVWWTQRMTLSGGLILYAIPAFESTTWGSLGSDTPLATFPSASGALKDYDPDASATNSGAAWKSVGVLSLKLVRVRYYSGEALLKIDIKPRSVDCSKVFTKP